MEISKGAPEVVSDLPEAKDVIAYITKADMTSEEALSFYDKWVSRFDQDMITIGFNGAMVTAEEVNEFCKDNKNVRILDLAAGTGALGKQLHTFQLINIDALDANAKMLDEARKTAFYKKCYLEILGKNRLHIDGNTYDVVTTCGSMIPGHLNGDCFLEVLRILKPGGLFIFSLWEKFTITAPEWAKKFYTQIDELESQGKWKIIAHKINLEYIKDSKHGGTVFVTEKL